MAEENISDAQRKLTEAMQQQALDYARYGQMQVTTSDQLRDAQVQAATGMKNYTAASGMAGKAIGALAGAGVAAAAEMYKGKKGMGAFNSSLDSLSEAATLAGAALTLLLPGGIIMKAVIGGLTMAATAAIAYTKAANDMADKLYKSYSGLQQSGAAASDGMTGVFEDAKKLGLSMDQLDSMVSLVAANSRDLAAFSGSAVQGRKQLANMGQSLKGTAEEFYKMGMSQEMVNEGLANYMRLQVRQGRTQTMSTDQLAASARNYIMEQDKLAQITGLNAKAQQDIKEAALNEEQFLAKTMEMRSKGQNAAADELETFNVLVTSMGENVAKGIRASVNGNLLDEAAQKLNFAAAGKQNEIIRKIQSGQMSAAQGAQQLAIVLGKYAKGTGQALGQIQAGETVGVPLAEANRAGLMAQNDFVKESAKAAEELEKRRKGQGDDLLDAQGNTIKTQRDINEKLERAVLKGIPGAQANMAKLSVATEFLADQFANLTDVLERIPGMGRKKDLVAEKSKEISGTEQKLADAKAAQKTAKTPEEKITADREEKFYKEKLELLKQEKIVVQTEQTLSAAKEVVMKRAQDEIDIAQALYDKQMETATWDQKYLKINQDASQKEARARLLAAQERKAELNALKDVQDAATKEQLAKKSGAAAPTSPAAPAAPTSPAAPAAAAPSAPATPAAPAAATDKSLAFTGASGSKSNFEQLNPAVKDRVTAAAEQFNEATGKKITVNSAKRDPADQARLYKETVDAGRPGIGPNGMAVAKPGRSKHEQGLAIDIQNYRDPAAVSAMNSKGLSQTVPKDPVHFEIPSAEEGGIVSGPASGYQTTMHGTEAVIPMQNNSGDFVKMFETMAVQSSRMADMLETLVRAQQAGNDISTKILRQQA
jgi:hypothetical protein